jgi:hypothetical protein
MIDGAGLHMEHRDSPRSLLIAEITAASNKIAQKIAHQLTAESKAKIKETRRKLLQETLKKAIKGETNWEITPEKFEKVFDFALEFEASDAYLENLRSELGLEDDLDITLTDIWKGINKLEHTDTQGKSYPPQLYSFEQKLGTINQKIEDLLQQVKEEQDAGLSLNDALRIAYFSLLEGTDLLDNLDKAMEMAKILSTLINERLIRAEKFARVVDPYSWVLIRLLFDLDTKYPDDTYNLSL